MMSLTPSSTPMDVNNVREVLALINDRDAAAKRLEELNAAAEKATAALDEQRKLDAELQARTDAYQAAANSLAADKAAFDAYNKKRSDELASMAAALNDRTREFEIREADSMASIAAREQAVGARERKVQQREDAVGERETKANSLISNYEQKLSALRSLAS